MKSTKKFRAKHLAYVFFLALAVRLLFSFIYAWTPDDAISYSKLAQNILAGHGFSQSPSPPYEPTLYRTPVYPYFLVSLFGLFGQRDIVVYLAQAIIGSLTCCLASVIALRYWNQSIALLAGMLNALYIHAARFTATILSETLFTFLFCCSIGFLVYGYQKRSMRWMVAAGGAMGIAILCRPEVVLLPPFLLVVVLLWHRARKARWKMTLAFTVVSLLMTVPWLVRNYQVTGKPTSLVKYGPGVAFWQSTLPYFDWNTFEYAPGAAEKDPLVWELMHKKMTEAELTAMEPRMWRAGFENIKRDPKTYLVRKVRAYPHLWIFSGDYLLGENNLSFGAAVAERRYGLIVVKVLLLAFLGLLPVALALVGLFVNKERLVELLPLWVPALYIGIFRVPFDLAPRNTLPLHPYVLMFAACGIWFVWNCWVKNGFRSFRNSGRASGSRGTG